MSYKSVGAILITDLGDGIPRAIIQMRGAYDFESMKAESWPGGSQVTIHGGIETGEEPLDTLFRETKEEFGNSFLPHIKKLYEERKLQKILHSEEGEKMRIFYGAIITKEMLKDISLAPSTGGLRFITKDDINSIKNIRDFDRSTGITDRSIIATFIEDKEAIEKAFEILT